MKKTLLTLAACAGFVMSAAAADAVVGLNESFENKIPATWTNVKVSGDKEFYGTSFTDKNTNETTYYAAMTGYKGTQPPFNAWLISPAVDIDKAAEKVLTFRTEVNSYGNQNSTFKVYVLTSNDPTTATTTELPATFAVAPESGYSSWTESGNLDLSSYKGTIYIGFNYVAPEEANYSTWCVTDIKLNADNAETPDTPDTGKGTLDAPLSVSDLLGIDCPAKDTGEAGWYVKGYIVGYNPGMAMSETVFGLPTSDEDKNTWNVVIGDSSAEDEVDACIPVQLPKGAVRDALNLVANPGNLGKCVVLQGTYEKYFNVPGLKKVTSYKFVEGGDTPVTPPTSGAIYEGLVNNADDFTYDGTAEYPEGYEYTVWSWSDKYGLVASAYDNSSSSSFVSDFWAISPSINLEGVETASMTLSQAANKFKDNADFMANTSVNVREEGGEWVELNLTPLPDGAANWDFIDCEPVSLSEFAGKKVQIGFHYTSRANGGGKWEIKNLKVTGSESGIATVETEEGEAVYYNLQGVRVMNPENGLYIERRGNKARKVVIK